MELICKYLSEQVFCAVLLLSVFSWKTASRMLTKGLRLFRDSLLEGAKVAHMFKEDVGEGVSSIMRQNRGVKNDQSKQDGSSSSFFDSQVN